MKKFEGVKIEKDTKVFSTQYIKVQNYDCRHEVWEWDGIKAESLIFCKSDFKEPVEENILSICEEHIGEDFDDSKHTFKPSGDFVFFNYNFVY